MALFRLNPITRKRLRRFRQFKRAYWSFWLLVVIYGLSLIGELLCNNTPVVMRFEGETYFPIIRFYPDDTFTGSGHDTRPDYKAINAGEATMQKHYSERVTGALLEDVVGKFGDGPGPRVPDEAYTYLLFHPRDTLLSLLPEAGTVAEVGVAKGVFSRRILELNHPRILHLIDPWAKQDEEDYAPDPANAPQDIQDERMDKVLKRLKAPIKRGQVVVHREFSGAAAATFESAAFDWVYIDAMHTYDAVLADLDGGSDPELS